MTVQVTACTMNPRITHPPQEVEVTINVALDAPRTVKVRYAFSSAMPFDLCPPKQLWVGPLQVTHGQILQVLRICPTTTPKPGDYSLEALVQQIAADGTIIDQDGCVVAFRVAAPTILPPRKPANDI